MAVRQNMPNTIIYHSTQNSMQNLKNMRSWLGKSMHDLFAILGEIDHPSEGPPASAVGPPLSICLGLKVLNCKTASRIFIKGIV